MRRLSIVLLCLLCLATAASAEDPLAWTVEIGQAGITTPRYMLPAGDDGVLIVGSTDDPGDTLGAPLDGQDGYAVRVDAQGNILWQRRMGGNADDIFTTATELPDGGFLLLGTTTSFNGDVRSNRGGMDAWLVRLDETGEVVWSKTLGGSLDDELFCILPTDEGQYFACGHTKSRNGDLGANYGGYDAWATLLNADDGKPLWTYRYGFEGDDAFLQALPIHDGWVLLGELGENSGTSEDGAQVYTPRPFIQMLSIEGVAAWESPITLGSTGKNQLSQIIEVENGWLLGGETDSRSALMPTHHGMDDIWLLQLRQSGSIAWQRTFGGTLDEALHRIYAVPSGGFILLGTTASNDGQVYGAHGGDDVWLVKVSATGALEWQQPIGGSDTSIAVEVLHLEDGGFLAVGTTLSQDGDIGRHLSVRAGFLSRLAPNGNLLSTIPLPLDEECTLVQAAAGDSSAYLLGSLRQISVDGPIQTLLLARLSIEGILE